MIQCHTFCIKKEECHQDTFLSRFSTGVLYEVYLQDMQGDKERQFCGKDYLPYEHWVAGNLAVSQTDLQDNPLEKDILVVLGSLLEFKKDEEVTIFHLLQPMNKEGMLYIYEMYYYVIICIMYSYW